MSNIPVTVTNNLKTENLSFTVALAFASVSAKCPDYFLNFFNRGYGSACVEQVVGSEQDGVAMIFCKYELIPGGFNVVANPSGFSMFAVGKPRGKMAPSSDVEASASAG